MTKRKIISTVGIVVFICIIWTAGLNFGLVHARTPVLTHVKDSSQVLEKPVYIEVEKPPEIVEVVRTVYVTQPVVVPVEVSRDVPVNLQDWDSVEQLEEFLKNDDTDQRIILIANNEGTVAFLGQCEDLALQLRDRAMAVGRYLSVQALNPNEYQKWYGSMVGANIYHAICMARIGNEFWYIEPSTDETWLALYLD